MAYPYYSVVDSQNIQLGQRGSIFVKGTNAATALKGVFSAIQFIEDTVFDSGTDGLVAEKQQRFLDSTGTGTEMSAAGGAAIDGETFPQGMTIYGRWTSFKLASGACIAYGG